MTDTQESDKSDDQPTQYETISGREYHPDASYRGPGKDSRSSDSLNLYLGSSIGKCGFDPRSRWGDCQAGVSRTVSLTARPRQRLPPTPRTFSKRPIPERPAWFGGTSGVLSLLGSFLGGVIGGGVAGEVAPLVAPGDQGMDQRRDFLGPERGLHELDEVFCAEGNGPTERPVVVIVARPEYIRPRRSWNRVATLVIGGQGPTIGRVEKMPSVFVNGGGKSRPASAGRLAKIPPGLFLGDLHGSTRFCYGKEGRESSKVFGADERSLDAAF